MAIGKRSALNWSQSRKTVLESRGLMKKWLKFGVAWYCFKFESRVFLSTLLRWRRFFLALFKSVIENGPVHICRNSRDVSMVVCASFLHNRNSHES